jgi:hypothetical protein
MNREGEMDAEPVLFAAATCSTTIRTAEMSVFV